MGSVKLKQEINFLISLSKNCIPLCQIFPLRTARCSYEAIIALALHSVILMVWMQISVTTRRTVRLTGTLWEIITDFLALLQSMLLLSSKKTGSSGIYWLWGPFEIQISCFFSGVKAKNPDETNPLSKARTNWTNSNRCDILSYTLSEIMLHLQSFTSFDIV